MHELQSLGRYEIGVLSMSAAEAKVMGPERKKLKKKS